MNAARVCNVTPAHDATEDERPSLTLILGGHDFRCQLQETIPRLRSRAWSLCRNSPEVDDLVQDTVERALKFEMQFIPGSNMMAWLNQILFSVFITKVRRRARERKAVDLMQNDPCAWFRTDAAPLLQELSPTLQGAIRALPDVFSQTLLLVDVAELPYKDAASELGVPVGTIMSRLHRARRMMRESLTAA